ncbi:hypothetical protein TRFO_17050 [Tritrichomonas foetus]|uniref:Uncharacterized protein n=1 Tax=Tritrichomonas foetus TaxID=1144522 RepID=A0A1J4KNQ3_9EUKA|nr:hypothetical protein TRFO_17050 [Tritrichomonas foetus]|eukprot:OHT12903.1 hypothetical protein TRFO_17050 [Tritrichomonas foetus]
MANVYDLAKNLLLFLLFFSCAIPNTKMSFQCNAGEFCHSFDDFKDKVSTSPLLTSDLYHENKYIAVIALAICKWKDVVGSFGKEISLKNVDYGVRFLNIYNECQDLTQATFYSYFEIRINEVFSKIKETYHEVQMKIHSNLKNGLTALANSFNRNTPIPQPDIALSNRIEDLYIVVISNILPQLENLQKIIHEADLDYRLEHINTKDMDMSKFVNNPAQMYSLIIQATRHKEEKKLPPPLHLSESLRQKLDDIVDNEKTILFENLKSEFDIHILPILTKIDFFLQCTWMTSVISAVMAHPPTSIFKSTYLPPDTFQNLEDDDVFDQIIDDMGKSRVTAVNTSARILINWRANLHNRCEEGLKKLSIIDGDIIDLLEEKQAEENEINNELKYQFSNEFSIFSEMTMPEVKLYINALQNYFENSHYGNDDEGVDALLGEEEEEEEEEGEEEEGEEDNGENNDGEEEEN